MPYKVDDHLTSWAAENGHKIMPGMVVLKDTPWIGVCNPEEDNSFLVGVAVVPESITKEFESAFKGLAKPYGTPVINKITGVLQIKVAGAGKAKRIEKLDAAVAAMPNILQQLNVHLQTLCSACGEPGCDAFSFDDGAPKPLHSACEQKAIDELIYQIENNRLNGNYGLATIVALLGAFVGAIPSFISIYFFDTLVWFLFALIPLCAAFAYKRANGIANKFMPVIVSLWSLITSLLLIIINLYLFDHQYWETEGYLPFLQNYLGFTGMMPIGMYIEIFIEMLQYDGEFLSAFMGSVGRVTLACAIGIWISWGYMTRTNKAQIQELKARQEAARMAQESHNEAQNKIDQPIN